MTLAALRAFSLFVLPAGRHDHGGGLRRLFRVFAKVTAADLLARVPDRDRRAVASNGVREAAAEYLAKSGDD